MTRISRRDFTRLLAVAGSATLLPPAPADASSATSILRGQRLPAAAPGSPDEKYWSGIRDQFLMAPDFAHINAANLCPTSRPVIASLDTWAHTMDADPSAATKARLTDAREETRTLLAAFLGVTPEEVIITRNTSEGNNFVSTGLTLGPSDDVALFADNHPSNLAAWKEKAKRYGFGVVVVPQLNPHPGTEFYVEAFRSAITPRTRLLGLTHVSNSVGDMLPVAEICAMARERGVLTLVDGAQSFGTLAVKPTVMGCDFYTGSAHKWLCGPRETGVLYVRKEALNRLTVSVTSLYAGRVGASRTFEAMGQRDEPALAALGDAVRFQNAIGREAVERRGRELTQFLIEETGKLDGVHIWTHPAMERSASVMTFRPGALDIRKLGTALYEKDKFSVTARTGEDRPGIRLSPHIYNTQVEAERFVATMKRYLASGV